MSKEKYTISEMADLLGVTTHMLRHYEKMDIIQPDVNPENGYRLYAGGGLLKDSVEELEWQETETKLDTMRNLFLKTA